MSSDIRRRLREAIREADERSVRDRRDRREVSADSARAFAPVRLAAEQVREELKSAPSINFTINPDSVGVSLVDRELWISYDPGSARFIGEESAHSWYDGERYAERYEWASADGCTESLIRLCAEYARMARAIAVPFAD